jgi:hypothetical protein
MRPLGAYRVHSNAMTSRQHDEMKMLARFVEQRATARLDGRPAPVLEAFVSSYRPTKAQRRQDCAQRQFRDARLLAMEGRYVKAAALCTVALVAQPLHTLRRIAMRLPARRTPSAVAHGTS